MGTRGFSLVEVVVALGLLGLGVAAALRASGALVGLTAQGVRVARAAAIAERYLERVAVDGCRSRSGRAVEGVYDVVWSVRVGPNRADVVVRLYWPTRRGMVSDSFVTAVWCP